VVLRWSRSPFTPIRITRRAHPPDATDEKYADNAEQEYEDEEGVVIDYVVHHPHLWCPERGPVGCVGGEAIGEEVRGKADRICNALGA
jgi:hypothetical protein